MAFRREKIKQQFEAVIPSLLEPGERPVAGTFAQSGPSPWLDVASVLGFFIILMAGARWYFIQVTDRRVLIIKASMWTQGPKGLAWADPRSSVQVHGAEKGHKLWSRFRYRRPDGKDIRMNVHRFWREDGQAVVAALTAPQQPQVPQPQIGLP